MGPGPVDRGFISTEESRMNIVHLHTEQGVKCVVLGEPGRLYTQYVLIDYPVRLRRIANGDIARYTRDAGYPLKKGLRSFLRIGRKNGITKGAAKLLRSGL